jgi:hypothetical protein
VCGDLSNAENLHRQPGCSALCGSGGVDDPGKDANHEIDIGRREVYPQDDAL